MVKTLTYIFDPLCGWCYGASATLSALKRESEIELRLLPSGLFSGTGARPMDDAFAAYAWTNDQRIERLTGQRFTERYHTQVLANRNQVFDSGPATAALTAVALTEPHREFDALKAIQQARYVEGKDVTQLNILVEVLEAEALHQAASRLRHRDADLLEANRSRIAAAQSGLQAFDARGVPTLILEVGDHRQLLHSSALYSNPQAFLDQLATA